jgi:hypothetical protein
MIENCGDTYGQYVDAHLTWMPRADAGKRDRYWAVFKYTFPECVQLNMLPRTWTPDAELDRNRSLLTGSGLWVRAEEELPAEIAETILFRRAINPWAMRATFCDTVGLRFAAGLEATRFDVPHAPGDSKLSNGEVLVIAWNRSDDPQPVAVEQVPLPCRAQRLVLGQSDQGWQDVQCEPAPDGSVPLLVQPEELCAFVLSPLKSAVWG